jgi:hypothetical protein
MKAASRNKSSILDGFASDRLRQAQTMSARIGVSSTLSQCRGFTLLELVLATLIATLVIGILSVALTFSMRMWEKQQNRKPTELPMMIDLMAMQLANFNSSPLPSELGSSTPLLMGDEHSLAVATTHSVKALSKGAPVVARYVFLPKEKLLYYAETPFDPYHPETLREFINLQPAVEDSRPRFYPLEVEDFSIEYSAEGEEDYSESWENGETLPLAVRVTWTSQDKAYSRLIVPDLPFSCAQPKVTGTTTPAGGPE